MTAVEHPVEPEELMAYRDGELTPERAAAVRSHVAACAECRALDSDLGRVSRGLAAWTVENAPETLRSGTSAAKSSGKSSFRPRWLPAWAFYPMTGVAAAGVAAVLIVGSSYRTQFGYTQAPSIEAKQLGGEVGRRDPAAAVAAGARAPVPMTTYVGGVPKGQVAMEQQSTPRQLSTTPRVVRTATLTLVAQDFDAARASLTRIVAEMGGFVGSLDVTGAPPDPRVVKATIRIPAARLDAALTSLKGIGSVTGESQSADDVTEQALDLEARIANGRHTEKRLNDLLQKRTGDLSDVLAAEREIARVREEIERLDAQRQNLENRVTYATVTLRIDEPHKSTVNLGPLPLSARFRNAFVDGFEVLFVSAVEVAIVALRVAPALLFWGVLILGPIYVVARRGRTASGIGRTGP